MRRVGARVASGGWWLTCNDRVLAVVVFLTSHQLGVLTTNMDHDIIDLRLVPIGRPGQRRKIGKPDQHVAASRVLGHVEGSAADCSVRALEPSEVIQRGGNWFVIVADLELDMSTAIGAELHHHLAQLYLFAYVEDQPRARL